MKHYSIILTSDLSKETMQSEKETDISTSERKNKIAKNIIPDKINLQMGRRNEIMYR